MPRESKELKIVIAPDSFKGSLSALEVAESLREGVLRVYPQSKIVLIPMADGGEGTLEAVLSATSAERITRSVSGPLGREVQADFALLKDENSALIELAQASGLTLVEERSRNALAASSRGTGELIKHALDLSVSKITITLGGSAMTDAGAGALSALGLRLFDRSGLPLADGGGALTDLARIESDELDQRLFDVNFGFACDVDNPLLGPKGSAATYARQKGADQAQIEQLERGLEKFIDLAEALGNHHVRDLPGAGAAGGFASGFLALGLGELKPGFELVAELVSLAPQISGADLVITGEGRIDHQTMHGKVPFGVANIAKRRNVPVIAVAGSLAEGCQALLDFGVAKAAALVQDSVDQAQAMKQAKSLLAARVEELLKEFKF